MRKDLVRMQNVLKQIKNLPGDPPSKPGGNSPEEQYKQNMLKKKQEIDSLKNVVSSQLTNQAAWDKQMQNYQSMINKVKKFSSSPENTILFNMSDQSATDRSSIDPTPKYDFSQDVENQKISHRYPNMPEDAPSYNTYVYFRDKDKKSIGISWGDRSYTDIFSTDYYKKPEGERPMVDPGTQKLLEQKQKAYEHQVQSGFSTTPKQQVIKTTPVNTGVKVWDGRQNKYVYAPSEISYRTWK